MRRGKEKSVTPVTPVTSPGCLGKNADSRVTERVTQGDAGKTGSVTARGVLRQLRREHAVWVFVAHEDRGDLKVLHDGPLPAAARRLIVDNHKALFDYLMGPPSERDIERARRAGLTITSTAATCKSHVQEDTLWRLTRHERPEPPPPTPWELAVDEYHPADRPGDGIRAPRWHHKPATDRQRALLRQKGFDVPKDATRGECSWVIDMLFRGYVKPPRVPVPDPKSEE